MPVILRPPPGWHWQDAATLVVPAPPTTPDVVVQVGPLILAPEDRLDWMTRTARAHPHGPVVTVAEAETPFVTESGWPALRTRLAFATAAGADVEFRVVVFYQFLHMVAAVAARGLTAAALQGRQDELRQLFVSAEPDFTTEEPVALADFWK